MADRSIGIMDPAYFVGRRELLEWINATLSLNLSKIEQTASGAVACQLMEAMFPGSIDMRKVNWEAKQDFQFVPNYKLLQKAFRTHQVSRHIDVPKLIRAKYQDNLEFMQWFKAFFESQPMREDYDPVAARAGGRGGRRANSNLVTDANVGSHQRRTTGRTTATAPAAHHNKENRTRRAAPTSAAAAACAPASSSSSSSAEVAQLRKRVATLEAELAAKTAEVTEAETQIESIDGEREFYYRKLLAVESLLQEEEARLPESEAGSSFSALIKAALKIMYETDDSADAAAADEPKVAAPTVPVAETQVEVETF